MKRRLIVVNAWPRRLAVTADLSSCLPSAVEPSVKVGCLDLVFASHRYTLNPWYNSLFCFFFQRDRGKRTRKQDEKGGAPGICWMHSDGINYSWHVLTRWWRWWRLRVVEALKHRMFYRNAYRLGLL